MIKTTRKQRKEVAEKLNKGERVEVEGIADLHLVDVLSPNRKTGKSLKGRRLWAKAKPEFTKMRNEMNL